MPYIPVPDVMQVETLFRWDSQAVENVYHFTASVAIDLAIMAELAAEMKDWWVTEMAPSVTNTLQLIQVKVTDLTTQTSPVYNFTSGLPVAGGSANPSLPNNVSVVYTKRTENRGRSFRGRIYHMGMTESQVTGNAVDTTTAASWLTKYNLTRSIVGASATYTQGVVSRFTGSAPRASGIITPILTFSTDALVDSQRRRLPGRGA